MGSATANGYDVVLIPHYGWGPPNPGGYEAIPSLAPGAAHTLFFSPGVIYGNNLGTFTLRILVTDDWYALGDPDSTGTNGDYEDHTINVVAFSCNPFKDMEVSIMMLSLPPDTRILPVYLKVDKEFFPGFEPDGDLPNEFIAMLGKEEATQVSQQGFPNRAYWMFYIPEGVEGTDQSFTLWWPDCPDPIYELPAIQIPFLKQITPTCSVDLNAEDCKAAGGSYQLVGRQYQCVCP